MSDRPERCDLDRARVDLFGIAEPEVVPGEPRPSVGGPAGTRGAALARALAVRLGAVMPDGFAVEALDGDLRATTRGARERHPIAVRLEGEGHGDAAVAGIVSEAVGGVQGFVSGRWPGGWPRCGVPGLPPPPRVEVAEGRIRVWFERRLELPEIAPEEWLAP